MSRDEQTTVGITRTEEEELGRAYLQLKQQYDELVNRSLSGIYRTTIQGRFLDCNEAMARILGYASREELMQVSCAELYFEAAERERFLHELREHRQLVNHPATLKHRSGRAIHVLENVFLAEQDGRPAAVVGTLIDITAMRQTELEQRSLISNYRELVEHARDGILIVQKGTVRYTNPAAEAMIGRAAVGDAFVSLIHPDDGEKLNDRLVELETTGPVGPISVRVAGPQASWKEMVLHAAATRHEGEPAAQLSLQDLGLQQSLMQERMRASMAEEVNQVLRQEISEHRRTQEALRQSKRFARS